GEIGPGAVLFVVHTWFANKGEEVIRLISARAATSKERRSYEEAHQKPGAPNRRHRREKGRRHWPVGDAGGGGLERHGNRKVLSAAEEACHHEAGHGHPKLAEELWARVPDQGKHFAAACHAGLLQTRAAQGQLTLMGPPA